MDDVETVRARLEVADLAADGVAGLLEAAWDAFGLVVAVSGECQDRSAELFAAFSFASAAAISGTTRSVGRPVSSPNVRLGDRPRDGRCGRS